MRVDINLQEQGDAVKKTKPKPPLKSAKVLERQTNALNRDNHSHVKDIVRQLQEKECEGMDRKRGPLQVRIPNIQTLDNMRSTNRTIEDLKAIDADIEKLRRQIEDRDLVINRLREETRTKDEQLQMMIMNRKGIDENVVGIMCTSPDASSVSSGSDGASPIPTEVISYLDFPNQQKTLKNDNDLDENRNESCTCRTIINEVKALREREAALLAEASLLREQNDLMEFRILELEECRPDDPVRSLWQGRDNEDVSDSGVMSLPTSEDLTSDSDQGDASGRGPIVEIKLTGVATVFPSVQPVSAKKDCLQESGIFEDGDISQSGSTHSDCTALFRATDNKASQTDLACSETPELSAELWKLSEIQKRIQSESKSPYTFCVTDCITFYEERLQQLQEKLSIYESRGDNRDRLLNKRLEKELSLSYEIRGLKETIAKLEERNLALEEERCEFEEAENDSRLQCQRLELQILEQAETKVQLEMENEKLQQNIREARKRAGRGGDLACKIFNLQSELEEMRNKASQDEQVLKDMEMQLEEKEEKMGALLNMKLNVPAASAKVITRQLGLDFCGDDKCGVESTEKELRERIDTLEKTNQAFIKALSDSDQIWATQEEEYKNHIAKLEKSYEEKLENANQEINQLQTNSEQISAKLKIAEHKLLEMDGIEVSNEVLRSQVEILSAEVISKDKLIKQLEFDNAASIEKIKTLGLELENEKKMSEARIRLETELMAQREIESQQKITELAKCLEEKNRVLSDLEVTTSELKEEVETLETQKAKTLSEISLSLVVEPKLKKNQSANVQKFSIDPSHQAFDYASERTAYLVNELCGLVQVIQSPEKSGRLEKNFQKLSLKNEELLKVLESMDEEEKQTVMEVKQLKGELEQTLLDLTASANDSTGIHRSDSGSAANSNSNINSSPTSTLQLALDNLQTKCRQKSYIVKTLFDLNERPEKMYQQSSDSESEDNLNLQRSDGTSHSFSIVKIYKVSETSLFVAWDPEPVPEDAEGYSISVNGVKCVVINGRHRNRAILNNLDLSKRCLIGVTPISRSQSFSLTATAVFPLLNHF